MRLSLFTLILVAMPAQAADLLGPSISLNTPISVPQVRQYYAGVATASDRHGTNTPGATAATCTMTFLSAYAAVADCLLTCWSATTAPFITSALMVGFGNAGKSTHLCEQ